jgi:hypothetical protein
MRHLKGKIVGFAVCILCPLILWSNPNCTMYEYTQDCVPSTVTPRTSSNCGGWWDCLTPNDQWCVDAYDATRDFDRLDTSSSAPYYCTWTFYPSPYPIFAPTTCGAAAFGAVNTYTCYYETCTGSCD